MFFHRHSRRFLHSRKTEKVLCQFLSQLCFIQLYSEATPSLEKWHSVPDCWSARRLQVRNKKHLLKSCPHGHYAPHCKNWPDTSYNTYLSIFSHPAHVRLQEIQSKESTKFKNKEAQVYSLCLFLHCCPVNKFFSTIFLDSIYMYQNTVCILLFLTHITL